MIPLLFFAKSSCICEHSDAIRSANDALISFSLSRSEDASIDFSSLLFLPNRSAAAESTSHSFVDNLSLRDVESSISRSVFCRKLSTSRLSDRVNL